MAGRCFFITEVMSQPVIGEMSDIARSEKITNLWPTPPSRPIDKSGLRDKSSQNQQRNKKKQDKNGTNEDGPGKNIDEYA